MKLFRCATRWTASSRTASSPAICSIAVELPPTCSRRRMASFSRFRCRAPMLTLKWQTNVQIPQGATVHWNGFQSGQYQQSFTLPAPINADRAEATYENGILMLNLPKAEHVKARTVKVTAKK